MLSGCATNIHNYQTLTSVAGMRCYQVIISSRVHYILTFTSKKKCLALMKFIMYTLTDEVLQEGDNAPGQFCDIIMYVYMSISTLNICYMYLNHLYIYAVNSQYEGV